MPKINMSKKVGAAGALGLVLLPMGVSVAHAEPVAIVSQEQHNVGALDDSGFWNRFKLSDGTFAFCNGDPQNPAGLNDFAYDNANITEINGAFTADGGTAWNDQQAHAAAYILSTEGATSSNPAAVQYAVMSLASPYYPGSGVGLSQEIIDAGEAMKADALAHAENFVNFGLGDVAVNVNSDARTGTVNTNVPAGKYNVTVTIEGAGATFMDGSTTITVPANDLAKTLDFKIPGDAGAGDVKVTLSSNDVPNTAFVIMTQPNWQDLFIAGKLKSASAEGVAAFAPTPPPPPPAEQPKPTPPSVTTVASDDVQLKDGKAVLFDNLKVSGDVPAGSYATVALYKLSGSTNEKEVLAGDLKCETPVATSKKIAIDKAGDYQTEKITVTEAGTYGFVETLYDKDGKVLDQGKCGEVTETVVVKPEAPKPTPPSVTTVASDDVQLKDGKAVLFDNLKVSGDVPAGAYATVALYKLSGSTNEKEVLAGDLKCETPVATSKKIAIDKAGDYQTEKITVTEAGTYGFVETLYDKNGKVLDQGKCGEVTETVVVKPEAPKPTPPAVSTVASDDVQLNEEGKAELFDNLKVTGDVPAGAYATVALYKLSDSTDEKAVLAGDLKCETPVATSGKIAIDKAGNYKTEKITVTEAGTYGFIETLYDKNGKVLDQGECGEESESVVVTPAPEKPQVTTFASDDVQLDENGKAELFDNLQVTGDVPAGAYVTVSLYKLSDSTDEKAVMAGDLKCETPVATTDKMEIAKAGDYQTEKITVTEAGTYGFVETLYDKNGKVLDQGDCGEASETVVVTPAPEKPQVTTFASDDVQLKDGKAELFDNLQVTGDVPEGAYVTVSLYKLSDSTDEKAVLAGDLKCETPVATTDQIKIPAAGNYQTEKITVTEAGTYGFIETLYDKDGNVLDQGECGEESESVVVTPEPTKPSEPTPPTPPAPSKPEQPAPVKPQVQTVVRSVVANTAAGAVQEAKEANLLAIAGGVGMAAAAVATVLLRRKK